MNFKELATAVAKLGLPLLGAALPIPGGAAIGAALASHIGAKSSDPADILTALTGSAEAMQKAKEFEATHQERMLELTSKYQAALAQAELEDRKSARQMATDTKAWTPSALSWLVVAGTLGMYGFLLYNGNPAKLDDVILGRILGTLDTSFGVVLAFWLGTSFSSRQKDSTIAKLSA